jgi:NAD(P)-dependent dehydrogenase (short-subunit alcohol dehydrogenase family)
VAIPYKLCTTTEVIAGVDLDGRTALVTGAAAGLGLETARALGAAGARLLVADVDRAEPEGLAERVRRLVPGVSVEGFRVDLGDPADVRQFAAAVAERTDRLDLLVNNAGVVRAEATYTAAGYEQTFAINYLGHFLLTLRLLPLLTASPDGARIVNLSSGAHRDSGIHWADPYFRERPFASRAAYAQSKSAMALFSFGLRDRLADRGIEAFTVRPARADTGIFSPLSPDQKAQFSTRVAAGRSGESVEVAAATSVWACVAPELAGHSGAYLSQCAIAGEPDRPGPPDAHASWIFDPAESDRLWAFAEQAVGETLESEQFEKGNR